MAFCDYCTCEDCRTGTVRAVELLTGKPVDCDIVLTHALTEFGDFICDVCWEFGEPIAWQDACGAEKSYWDEDGYRPAIVGEWRTLAEERTL